MNNNHTIEQYTLLTQTFWFMKQVTRVDSYSKANFLCMDYNGVALLQLLQWTDLQTTII